MRILKLVWARWKVIAHAIGDVQARIILSVFYFAVVGPFALMVRLSSDPLRLSPQLTPVWLPREPAPGDALSAARRQF